MTQSSYAMYYRIYSFLLCISLASTLYGGDQFPKPLPIWPLDFEKIEFPIGYVPDKVAEAPSVITVTTKLSENKIPVSIPQEATLAAAQRKLMLYRLKSWWSSFGKNGWRTEQKVDNVKAEDLVKQYALLAQKNKFTAKKWLKERENVYLARAESAELEVLKKAAELDVANKKYALASARQIKALNAGGYSWWHYIWSDPDAAVAQLESEKTRKEKEFLSAQKEFEAARAEWELLRRAGIEIISVPQIN